MIRKKVTYTNFEGAIVTEELMFNLNKPELIKLNASIAGGLDVAVKKAMDNNDENLMYNIIEKLIVAAYGEKSADGKRFYKNKEMHESFVCSEAYSQLLDDFVADPQSLETFIKNITPKVEEPVTPNRKAIEG